MRANPRLVGIEAARATLKDLCAAAARGEEVVITRRGRPIARVVGVDKPCPRCGVPHADAGSDVVPCPRCGERFPRAFPGQNARIEAALVPRRHEPLAVTYARVLRERDLDEVVAYRANGSPLTRAEMADLIDAGDAEALRYLDLFAASGVRAMGVKARREHEGKPKSS